MNSQFGQIIKTLSGKRKFYLRQVAPLLEMDTAQLSKIEKELRQIQRDQMPISAKILKAEIDELLILWVDDQIIEITTGEEIALQAI